MKEALSSLPKWIVWLLKKSTHEEDPWGRTLSKIGKYMCWDSEPTVFWDVKKIAGKGFSRGRVEFGYGPLEDSRKPRPVKNPERNGESERVARGTKPTSAKGSRDEGDCGRVCTYICEASFQVTVYYMERALDSKLFVSVYIRVAKLLSCDCPMSVPGFIAQVKVRIQWHSEFNIKF